MVNKQFVKTRIAPTPSGFLHLGNALSFALTARLAENSGAKLLLRIDDLDQARVNRAYLNDIFDTLNYLKITWYEGPRSVDEFERKYSQLHRMDLYREALKQLSDGGLVFACTCSRTAAHNCNCFDKHIPLNTPHVSWRLITDDKIKLSVKNYNSEIINSILPAEMKNFIVKKKDGFPAYQLTSIIDDLYYGVDLVVRGNDLWPSTLAQQQLAVTVNKPDFGNITFYHHPLLVETNGIKLSKSAGATSIKHLRESGKTSADIYRLIAGMIGVDERVSSWQELGEKVTNNFNTLPKEGCGWQ